MVSATGNCLTVPNSWMVRPFWCSQGWLPSDRCSTDDDFGLLTPELLRERTEDRAGAVRPAPSPRRQSTSRVPSPQTLGVVRTFAFHLGSAAVQAL